MPLPADKQPYVKDVEGVDNRLTILWFTEGDSLDAWDEFAGAGELVEATGLGRVELMAPFTPTLPGTDRYVDELRGDRVGIPHRHAERGEAAHSRRGSRRAPDPKDDEMARTRPAWSSSSWSSPATNSPARSSRRSAT